MIRQLVVLADSLDRKGFYREASQIDQLLIFARLEEFQEDLELFRTSFLLEDSTTRTVIERLLELYNKVGYQARKNNESTRPRLSDPTEKELMIPLSSIDPTVAKESLRILLESAKAQISYKLTEGLRSGHWNAIAIKTYLNKIERDFDINVKRKFDPIESVVIDFLNMVLNIKLYF